jgi:hypothetical protein
MIAAMITMLISMENVSKNSKINVMIIVFVATTFLGTLFLLGHKLLLRCTIYESYDSSSLISHYD